MGILQSHADLCVLFVVGFFILFFGIIFVCGFSVFVLCFSGGGRGCLFCFL